MPQKILAICLISVLLGCNNEFRFENNFIEHFPTSLKSELMYYEYTMKLPDEFKQYGASKKEVFKYQGLIKSYVDTLINSAINQVSYTDSCIIVLPIRYSKNVDIGKPIVNDCFNDYQSHVIPNISELAEYLTIESSDFTFYIIENKAGEYLDKQDLFTDNIMPKPWINGYTKGVAINRTNDLVLFWIDIW